MRIVDAHLDLSYNAAMGRDPTAPAIAQPPDDMGIPTVGLPDLRAGGVGLVCATIFCEPHSKERPGYHNGQEAAAQAEMQWKWYEAWQAEGSLQFVKQPAELESTSQSAIGNRQLAILLLEGADPLNSSEDVARWHQRGLRIVGLAWHRTRMAGGTGEPGPLTPEGIRLVTELDRFGIIHDASHLAEESFWNLLEKSRGPVMASHSNCRAIVPTDRQLSDDMIRAIIQRGGVIGINFYDRFLLPPDQFGKRRATLNDVLLHIRHICDLAGNARHVGLGTDMDGGLGREQIPVEITTSADLHKVADALTGAGYPADAVTGIMGENWRRYFAQNLSGAVAFTSSPCTQGED